MCLTCGCGKAHDNHGNPQYLTVDKLKEDSDFQASVSLDDLTAQQAVKNTLEALENDRSEHPEEYT